MSQLLSRLNQQLLESNDPFLSAELMARIAAYLARVGRFDEAAEMVSRLRDSYGDGRSGRITVLIMVAEGLRHHFSDLSKAAMERIRGAQVLASAMKYPAGLAFASAWKAHLEFEVSDFDSMVRSIRTAFENLPNGDDDTLTRLAAVLANSFMIVGDRVAAQIWFAKGLEAAQRNGDRASVEALWYNRTTFGLAMTRIDACLGGSRLPDLGLLRGEIESARNFQKLVQAAALTNHIELWSARLFFLQGDYQAAIDALRAVRTSGPFAGHNFSQSLVDLEISLCHAKLGEVDVALANCEGMSFEFVEQLDIDEQFLIAWMRAELAKIDSRFGDEVERGSFLAEMKEAYLVGRERLRFLIAEWNPNSEHSKDSAP